ncbi:hypothetical protein E0L36_11565 [Streptomyces sp. AJS327]|nr:hypothetical protein [Streptomyces sp. AJS327]
MRGRCGAGAGPVRGRCGAGAGPVRGRCGAGAGPVRARASDERRAGRGSRWCRPPRSGRAPGRGPGARMFQGVWPPVPVGSGPAANSPSDGGTWPGGPCGSAVRRAKVSSLRSCGTSRPSGCPRGSRCSPRRTSTWSHRWR